MDTNAFMKEHKLIIPNKINSGDGVALITPGHRITKSMLEQARTYVSQLGLQIIYQPELRVYGYFAGTVKERVEEIHEVFSDPRVHMVWAVRGGSGTIGLLPYLDYGLISSCPKVVMGMSDVSILLNALYKKTGLLTFHGPVASQKSSKSVCQAISSFIFENSNGVKQSLQAIEKGNLVTLYSGRTEGQLLGGNLTTLINMMGTGYQSVCWQDKILFLEDVNEEIYAVDRWMAQLQVSGLLEQLAGIIFGRFTNSKSSVLGSFSLEEVFMRYVSQCHVPSFMGALVGHQSEQWIMPIGSRVVMDADEGSIQCLHSVTK